MLDAMKYLLLISSIVFVNTGYACGDGEGKDLRSHIALATVESVADACTSFNVVLLNEIPESPGRVVSNVYLQVMHDKETVASSSDLRLDVKDSYSVVSFCINPEFIGESRLDIWTREKVSVVLEGRMITTIQSGSLCNEPIEIGLPAVVAASNR